MNIFPFLTMKTDTIYIDSDSTIRQALEKMDCHKYSVIPLINDNGGYEGTVSEGDILRYIKNNCNLDISKSEEIRVLDIERYRPYKAMHISSSIYDLLSISKEQNFVPIVDDRDMFIGIVTRKTVLEYFSNEIKEIFKKYE